jgi:succinate dehydrogenase / fumarate reductase cytochrome b subunit
MTMPQRPLAPHLQVYRLWPIMVLSILHRITGVALVAGLVLLCAWLYALAAGPAAYAGVAALLGSPLGLLVLLGLVVAFWYHFCAGMRHLLWDTGRALERQAARRLRVLLVVVVLILAGLSYAVLWHRYGGSP